VPLNHGATLAHCNEKRRDLLAAQPEVGNRLKRIDRLRRKRSRWSVSLARQLGVVPDRSAALLAIDLVMRSKS